MSEFTPPEPTPPIASGDRPAKPSLTQETSSGFAWLLMQTVGSKGVNFIGQTILAYLLDPDHWGLVGLAYTFVTFVGLIQSNGVSQVLVHRDRSFRRWANAGFWMSLALGFVAAGLLAALSPLAAATFEEPALAGIVLVLAASYPLHSLSVVTIAALRNDHRFKFLAASNVVFTVLTMTLSVVLAAFGFGAYAFVIPVPVVAAFRAVTFFAATRPPIRWNPQFRRWRYLMGESVIVMAAAALFALVSQGDKFILGEFHSTEVVGLYFWAYGMSRQTMTLFGTNLRNILFPMLSKLQSDVVRQTKACLRASRMLAMVCVPACLMQAALAEAGTHLIFPEKWYPAIPALQILSLGMTFRLVEYPAMSLIGAQGRWWAYFYFGLAYAPTFLVAVTIAAMLGGANSVAVATGIVVGPIGATSMILAVRPGGGTVRDVLTIFRAPLLTGVLAIGVPTVALLWLPDGRFADVTRMIVIPMVGGSLYMLMIRRQCPEEWGELARIVGGMARSKLGRRRADVTPASDERSVRRWRRRRS